ncbi:MAG: glycosyltransferase [Pseudomonadota bacterium]
MRILNVLSNLAPSYGGPVQVAREMTARLAARGHEVSIYTTNLDYPRGVRDVPLNRPVEENGVTIRYFPVEWTPMFVSLGLGRALARDVPSFDIVHVHGVYRYPQVIAGMMARRHRVPYLVRTYGSLTPFMYHKNERKLPKRIYEHLFMYRLLNRAAAIHYTTREEAEQMAFLKLRAPRLVVSNGVEAARYHRPDLAGAFRARHGLEGRLIVLHYGRITMKKGLDILVPAFARLRQAVPDAMLVLAGADNEGFGTKVRGWIAAHGLEANVLFTGLLHGDEALAALTDADIFALASYTENFGISVVEAMAAGRPVLISDQVNIWREIDAAGAGIVVPCDVDRCGEALLRLANDPELRRTMGAAAQRAARRQFDWDHIIGDMEAAYARYARPASPAGDARPATMPPVG